MLVLFEGIAVHLIERQTAIVTEEIHREKLDVHQTPHLKKPDARCVVLDAQ